MNEDNFSGLLKSPDFIAGLCIGLAAGLLLAVLIGGGQ